jgi:hypothetical protein
MKELRPAQNDSLIVLILNIVTDGISVTSHIHNKIDNF